MNICKLCGFKTIDKEGNTFLTSWEKAFICDECVKKVVKQARIRKIVPK